jgi:hypothetical protein
MRVCVGVVGCVRGLVAVSLCVCVLADGWVHDSRGADTNIVHACGCCERCSFVLAHVGFVRLQFRCVFFMKTLIEFRMNSALHMACWCQGRERGRVDGVPLVVEAAAHVVERVRHGMHFLAAKHSRQHANTKQQREGAPGVTETQQLRFPVVHRGRPAHNTHTHALSPGQLKVGRELHLQQPRVYE